MVDRDLRVARSGLRRLMLVCLVAGSWLAPQSAGAGALTGATYSFSLDGGTPLVFAADGSLTGTGVSLTEVALQPGSAFAGTATLASPLPDLSVASELTVFVTNHLGGTWAGDPLTGTAVRIHGQSTIYGFGGVSLIRVPFAAGEAGTTSIQEGGVSIDIFAQGWTSGVLAISDGSGGTMAQATGTVSTGTPGSVTLVSGSRIETSLADDMFHIHTLHLEFESLAPEPVGLLTLSAVGCVLAIRARRRRS